MATISFLWHLHQPAYRTADGVAHAPWVALHAGGSYTTLARTISEAGARGQVLNIVPTLLEQLLAYRDGGVIDPVLDVLTRPATDLDSSERATLLDWVFHVTPRQLGRYPRLQSIASRRDSAGGPDQPARHCRPEELRDLQVLFILAQAGDQAWRDHRLAELHKRGRDFDGAQHETAVAWLLAQPGELIERWRGIADLTGVEIATSPYAHPILPLLIDTAIVRDSWAPDPAPEVPSFRHPADARRQLQEGLEYMRRRGFRPRGCWPPEGSLSADAVRIYGEAAVRWLVADEGILERSLDRPLRDGEQAAPDLYRAWRLSGDSPAIVFRDRRLSDLIGFGFSTWGHEAEAARELVRQLRELAHRLPEDAAIVIALDGENPWLHYPAGGGEFLFELFQRLNDAAPELEPATLDDACSRAASSELERIHPGSWIHAVFATWIGHPEKSAAWGLLGEIREAVGSGDGPPPSMLLAEGSDWFWWLGDDNPTDLAPLYDEIFRQHLRDACEQAGVEPPPCLDRPLKARPPSRK
jgi:alpha-amylase/alpha-mannosidase (GH57 family)